MAACDVFVYQILPPASVRPYVNVAFRLVAKVYQSKRNHIRLARSVGKVRTDAAIMNRSFCGGSSINWRRTASSAAVSTGLTMLNRSNRRLDATLVARINCLRQVAPPSVTLARQEFVAMTAVLDRHMEGRQFIVNDSIAVADCSTAYPLDWEISGG